MIVSGWSNGSPSNRDWDFVEIELDYDIVKVRLSNSFWEGCTELRSSKIGKWMLEKGFAPWPKGNPPKFELVQVSGNRFKLVP